MNVTDEPEQAGLLPADIATEIDGVSNGFTVMVIALDKALAVVKHAAFDVMIQRTTCALFKDELVYVALFVPTFTPSTCH
mgnify:CR=1 FL=1